MLLFLGAHIEKLFVFPLQEHKRVARHVVDNNKEGKYEEKEIDEKQSKAQCFRGQCRLR